MKLLSLDLGGKNIGWAVFLNTDLLFSGKLTLKNPCPFTNGNEFSEWLLKLIKKHKPEVIATERPFKQNPSFRGKQDWTIGYTFVLGMISKLKGIAFKLLAPTSIKKIVSGDGRADKATVRFVVNQITGREIKSLHE